MALAVRLPEDFLFVDTDGLLIRTSRAQSRPLTDSNVSITGSSAFDLRSSRAMLYALKPDVRALGCEVYHVSSEVDYYRIWLRYPDLLPDDFVRFENTDSSFLSCFDEAERSATGSGRCESSERESPTTPVFERISLADASRLAVRILRDAEAEREKAAVVEARVGIDWAEKE